jgi:hypothetical protein
VAKIIFASTSGWIIRVDDIVAFEADDSTDPLTVRVWTRHRENPVVFTSNNTKPFIMELFKTNMTDVP